MTTTRRSVLTGLLSFTACPAVANFSLGTGTLTTVSDGHLTLPGDFFFASMPQDELDTILDAASVSRSEVMPECNLTLYRYEDKAVLFDVGSGTDFMPSAGQVMDSLDAIDMAPDEITHVIFTHAHPDHIWGVLDDFDDLAFPEATYMIGRAEWDYWWDPNTVDSIGEARAAFAVGAKRRMEAIEDQTVLFDPGDEILPGISAVPSFGHTPGHMSFEIRDGGDAVMVVGDAVGNHHVALHRPTWRSGADQDADQAVDSRIALLDRLTSEDLRIAGFHLPQGGLGRIITAGDGYRFLPEGA